jgi:hypothetical protein
MIFRLKCRSKKAVWQYIWRKQKRAIIIYVVVLAVAIAAAIGIGFNAVVAAADTWGKLTAILSAASIGVGLLVWLTEAKQDWEDSLPKKLNAIYWLDGELGSERPFAACMDATLSGESDLRAMSQQIIAQICSSQRLAFAPRFDILPATIDRKTGTKKYTVYVYLTELPQNIIDLQKQQIKAGILRGISGGRWQDETIPDFPNDPRVGRLLIETHP